MKKLIWKGVVALAVSLSAEQGFGQAGVDWQLLGNAGTTNAHYVGTSDARPLVLRTTALERMRILAGGDNWDWLYNPNFKIACDLGWKHGRCVSS